MKRKLPREKKKTKKQLREEERKEKEEESKREIHRLRDKYLNGSGSGVETG